MVLLVAYLLFRRIANVSVTHGLLLLAIVSEQWFSGIDFGPFSIRVYLMVLLLAWIVWLSVRNREPLLRTSEAKGLLLLYTAFVLWSSLDGFITGTPIERIIIHVSSTHLLAILAFLTTQYLLRRNFEFVWTVWVMVATALLSGLFAIVQWFGVDWAWHVALRLHPGEEDLVLGTRFGSWGFVPGLAVYSIPLSYHLITFGSFGHAYWVHSVVKGFSLGARLFALVISLLLGVATLLTQSRSAAVAYTMSMVAAIALNAWYMRKRLTTKMIAQTMLPLVLSVSVLAVLDGAVQSSVAEAAKKSPAALGSVEPSSEDSTRVDSSETPKPKAGEGNYRTNRIFKFKDSTRAALLWFSINYILDNPWTSGSLSDFGSLIAESEDPRLPDRPLTPHNLFLNAAVGYGIPGLLLIVLLVWKVCTVCWKMLVELSPKVEVHWVGIGAAIGLLAYLVNGQFHNDGFVTGGTLGWWLLGVITALKASESASLASSSTTIRAVVGLKGVERRE